MYVPFCEKTIDYLKGLRKELIIEKVKSVASVREGEGGSHPPRREVYARFFTDQRQISASFGGHEVPEGWGWLKEEGASGDDEEKAPEKSKKRKGRKRRKLADEERAIPSAGDTLSAILTECRQMGDTIAAARALQYTELDSLDAEKQVLVGQAFELRDQILPRPLEAIESIEKGETPGLQGAATLSAAGSDSWKQVQISLYKMDVNKLGPIPLPPLPVGTHHSATRTRTYE
jgi:hypothetical protein